MKRTSEYVAHVRKNGEIHSLEDHLMGTGDLTSKFAGKINCQELGRIIGDLHDIGKYSSQFQNYIKTATGIIDFDIDDKNSSETRVDHSTAGAQFIWNFLQEQSDLNDNYPKEFVAFVASIIIASHHSGLIDILSPEPRRIGDNIFRTRMAKEDSKTNALEAIDNFKNGIVWPQVEASLKSKKFREEIDHLWNLFAKNNTQIDYINRYFYLRFLFSCLIDADRLDTANFCNLGSVNLRKNGTFAPWSFFLGKLNKKIKEFDKQSSQISKTRSTISDECFAASARPQGIFTLTVPTGGGKTLASMRFAIAHANKYHLDKIVYVTPFTSITDQNADVARSIFGNQNVLEHHSNIIPEHQTYRTKLLSENWDNRLVFTTMVQYLNSLFSGGTRGARRFHQLSNSVVVFDEIQSLPIKTVHLFNNSINFLVENLNCTVVLCTATQPLLHEVDKKKGALSLSEKSEIVSDPTVLFENLKRTEVEFLEKEQGISEISDAALKNVADAGSCLVIVNTKKLARKIHDELNQRNKCEVYHLSTNMYPKHRRTVLGSVQASLNANKPIICVSTQLIEAGVDVDFGSVIRTMAGLPSIHQAAGRCNRNGKRKIGKVTVINCENEEKLQHESLEEIREGRNVTKRILNELGKENIFSLDAIQKYYKYFFYARRNEMEYPLPSGDSMLNLLTLNQPAKDRRRPDGPWPTLMMPGAFMTANKAFQAIDSNNSSVIVGTDEAQESIAKFRDDFLNDKISTQSRRNLQQFTIDLPHYQVDKLKKQNALKEIAPGFPTQVLRKNFYSMEHGVEV